VLTDTHTHLNHPDLDSDQEAVLTRAREAGVTWMLIIGYDLPSSRRAVEMAQAIPGAFAAVGVHPHDASLCDEAALEELSVLADDSRVVAIGEIGLDFYRDLSPRDAQYRAFSWQIALAHRKHLPLIIHSRDASEEVYRVLVSEAQDLKVVLHCFSGTKEYAARCLEAGFWLGIGGPLTFKKNTELQAIVQVMPMERLLLETDAPYLAPDPYRGRRNEPAHVRLVAQKTAELRGIALEEVARMTSQNASQIFGLDGSEISTPLR